jgi:acetyl-CoA decarbonylase/synthase complex subunit gamma
VPVIATELAWRDRLGAWKARWGIGRMRYLVPPGLYAIGLPGPDAPVVVTANYKMSYDLVRRELAGRNLWLLVLETHGINVWCAAGKGTFGTDELVRRVEAAGLGRVVSHRQLLLPILGAPGVAAHLVKQETGFTVRYATLRAADLPAFLDNGMQSTEAMRDLTFTLGERLVLVPIELLGGLKTSRYLLPLFFLAGGFGGKQFSLAGAGAGLAIYFGALLAGTVVAPLLLPWLPNRSFSVKGAALGGAGGVLLYLIFGPGWRWSETVALLLALPAVAGFFALNFTGSTPFTSPSGVKREMRLALPVMACALLAAALVWLTGRFLL